MIKLNNIKVGDTLLCQVPKNIMEKHPYTKIYDGQKFKVTDVMDVFDSNFNKIKAIVVNGIDIPESFKISDKHYDWYTKIDL